MLLCCISLLSVAQDVTLQSPNGRILVKIQISKEDIRYSVQMAKETIMKLEYSPISRYCLIVESTLICFA